MVRVWKMPVIWTKRFYPLSGRNNFQTKASQAELHAHAFQCQLRLRNQIDIAVKTRHIQQEYTIYEQNEPRTTCNIIMSSKPYRVGQWIPSDQKVLDKWLANLITEVKSKSKDKLALLMALHPPAEDEETARGENQLTVAEGTEEDLGLHPPVQELLKAITSDPELNMFFHQMFWQQNNSDSSKGTRIPCWQLMICQGEKIMYFNFRTNSIFIYRFRPSSVFCSFFYSTGWAVKNGERVVLFKLLIIQISYNQKK